MDKSRVALVQGTTGRYENVVAALDNLSGDIDLAGIRRVLIKPNFVSTTNQAASTHVDAVHAVVEFVRARYDGPIVVGEGAAVSPTSEGFRNFGYESLADAYAAGAGIELVDLNADDVVPVCILDRRFRPRTAYLARTAAEDGVYRISVGIPKTHDCVLVTLAIKNMVMGALVNPRAIDHSGGTPGWARRLAHLMPRWVRQSVLAEWAKGALLSGPGGSSKLAMHQGLQAMNVNLALVAAHVWPHLAVLDGWQGMEGEGPGAGDPLDWRVVLASTDPLAADVLATHLMGFDPRQVGYLQYCGQMGLGVVALEQIEVLGNAAPEAVRRSFKPHPTYRRQLRWRVADVERYLARA
jgi:uncharacterized protein (DUF362 family)